MYVSRSDILRMIAEANFLEPEGQGLDTTTTSSSSSSSKNKSKNKSSSSGDDGCHMVSNDNDEEEEDKCDLVSFAQFKTIASRSLTLAHGGAQKPGLGPGSAQGPGLGSEEGLDQDVARLWRKVATKPKVLEKGTWLW